MDKNKDGMIQLSEWVAGLKLQTNNNPTDHTLTEEQRKILEERLAQDEGNVEQATLNIQRSYRGSIARKEVTNLHYEVYKEGERRRLEQERAMLDMHEAGGGGGGRRGGGGLPSSASSSSPSSFSFSSSSSSSTTTTTSSSAASPFVAALGMETGYGVIVSPLKAASMGGSRGGGGGGGGGGQNRRTRPTRPAGGVTPPSSSSRRPVTEGSTISRASKVEVASQLMVSTALKEGIVARVRADMVGET
jgi:hypothetical protein